MQNVTLKIQRKSETDEWLVVVTVNGTRHEGRTYYTSDREDADCTMRAMAEEALLNGERVNGITFGSLLDETSHPDCSGRIITLVNRLLHLEALRGSARPNLMHDYNGETCDYDR
jgi:hypothetical protein